MDSAKVLRKIWDLRQRQRRLQHQQACFDEAPCIVCTASYTPSCVRFRISGGGSDYSYSFVAVLVLGSEDIYRAIHSYRSTVIDVSFSG